MIKSEEESREDIANQLNQVLSDSDAMIIKKVKKSIGEERSTQMSTQMEEMKNQIQLLSKEILINKNTLKKSSNFLSSKVGSIRNENLSQIEQVATICNTHFSDAKKGKGSLEKRIDKIDD